MHVFRGLQNPERCHWSDQFQKIRRFFFRKLVLQGYWGPGCHLNTLIDLSNIALASKRSVRTICFFSEGYRNQRGVTGPINFKKKNRRFFSENRAPGVLGPLAAIQAL